MDLSLKIELDTDHKGGLGVLALVVDCATEELACRWMMGQPGVLVAVGRAFSSKYLPAG